MRTTLQGPENPPGKDSITSPERLVKYHWVERRSVPYKPVKRGNIGQLIVRQPRGVVTGRDGWETVEKGLEVLEVSAQSNK